MLARITYGLVAAAVVFLILGFFQQGSNTFLYVSIGLSLASLAAVIADAVRRARALGAEGGEAAVVEEEAGAAEELPADLGAFGEEAGELEEVEEEEEEVAPPPRRTARPPAAATRPKPAARVSAKVVVVPGRDRYHTASCRFIQGKEGTEEISVTTARRRGYRPCSACKPG